MIWADINISKKSLIEQCGGREKLKQTGTDTPVFYSVLATLPGIDIKKIGYKSHLNAIRRHLKKGGIIAIAYLIKDSWGHYTICVGHKKGKYLLANKDDDVVLSKISGKTFRKLLDEDDFLLGTYNCSVLFFIEKSK